MISIQNIKDKQLWERFILDYQRGVGNPEGGAFLQSLAWEEFQKKLGKEIFRIGLLENDKLVGTSLIILQKAKAASFLYVPVGPIFLKWGKKYFEEWLKYVSELANRKKATFLRVEPRIIPEAAKKLLKEAGFLEAAAYTQPKCTAVFDLTKNEAELLGAASDSTRYNIRASVRKGVGVREGRAEEIETFVDLLRETAQRKSLTLPAERDYHKVQFETLQKGGLMKLFIAEAGGEALGAALVLFYGDSAYYLHAAGSIKKKQLRASYPLVWHTILESKRQNLKWFDFWGIAASEDSKDPWAGVTSFKLSFGAKRICFDPPYDLPFGGGYKFSRLIETWRKPIRKIVRFS